MKMFIALTLLASGVANAQVGDTAYGDNALFSNVSGDKDSAFGFNALYSNTSGLGNTAVGYNSLVANDIGTGNSAMGTETLPNNTTGLYNSAQGYRSMLTNTTGQYNTALGTYALYSSDHGDYNTAVGNGALYSNYSGSNNIGIGHNAGYFPSGSYNIEIGANGLKADNGVIRIGTQGTQHFTQIAGISGVKVTGGAQVLVNARGQLGVASSSLRYKENVHSMDDASNKVLALRTRDIPIQGGRRRWEQADAIRSHR